MADTVLPITKALDEALSHGPPIDTISTLQNQHRWSIAQLPTLLSPTMRPHLEWLAQVSHRLTVQRFGKTLQLFAPIYLSNVCYNQCTYCSFSVEHRYPRKTLTEPELIAEYNYVNRKGFRQCLLLTGDAPGCVDVPYISEAITLARSSFDSIGLEVQPFDQTAYETFIAQGADSLTLYQETYHKPTYLTHHVRGKKRDYAGRLAAVEAGARAGFHRMTIGVLLGLYDWRYEAICLAHHLHDLQSRYNHVQFGVSFPRIQNTLGDYTIHYPITDAEFVQLICAFRLVFPDITITLSTREAPALRDHLIPLGITLVSAESKTNPGGYSGDQSQSQFDTTDHRPLQTIHNAIVQAGYCPVYKDWQS